MAAIDGFDALAERAVGRRGDAVLHDAGARLARTLRSGDVIVRWDGPEFLMMLPDTDRDGTHRAAERLRRSIAAAPFTVGPETVELTVSVGWADWRGEDPSEFKLRVERSLRQAREAGGDVVRPGGGRRPSQLQLPSRSASRRIPSASAAFAPPARSVGASGTGSISISTSVAISLNERSSAACSISARRTEGFSRIAPRIACSRSPLRWRMSAAVFSPMPFAPGRPSDGSPRRAMKSGTSSGPMP